MKKYRICSLLLCAALLAGLFLPTTALAIPEMDVDATAAILVDMDYREVLYAKNAHEQRYPASITKVMTALLTIEAVERGELAMDQVITASDTFQRDLSADGSTQNIRPGEEMSVQNLLYCALVASANEACNILAEAVAGDIDTFVSLMNQRAVELGMEDTHFVNAHGLHRDEHYTTAYDISLMVMEALGHESFRQIVATTDYRVPATNLSEERYFYNTNGLLSNWRYVGYTYSSAIGVKTGHTPEAGYCLASAAVEDGRTLVAVVLGCEREPNTTGSAGHTYFSESKRLLQWGFSYFERKVIAEGSEPIAEVEVTLSRENDHVLVEPQGQLEATLPVDVDPADFQQNVELFAQSVPAPVERGQVMGRVTYSYDGKEYGTLDLVAVDGVARSELLYHLDRLQHFFSQLWVRVLCVVLAILILILVVRHLLFGRRRGRYAGGGYGGRRRRRR